jgi:hypothetical protein
MTTAKRLKARLFLEGREVPVISAVVEGTLGKPMAASIQIPPASSGTMLLPRTLVHLFFDDFYNEHKHDITNDLNRAVGILLVLYSLKTRWKK